MIHKDHDEIMGTDCPCPICEELAEVHNIAMQGEEAWPPEEYV